MEKKTFFIRDLKEIFEEMNRQIANWLPINTIFGTECVKIQKLVGGVYFDLWNENVNLSKDRCQKEINQMYGFISDKIKKQEYSSLDEFHLDISNLKQQYLEVSLVFH